MILKARGRHWERERAKKTTTFIQLGKTFCSLWSWHLVFSFTIGESVTKHAHMLGAFHPIPCLAFCMHCVSRGPCECRHPGRMWWCDGGAWWLGGGDASWRGMELNGPSKTGHSRRMPKSLCDNLYEILISYDHGDHAWKIVNDFGILRQFSWCIGYNLYSWWYESISVYQLVTSAIVGGVIIERHGQVNGVEPPFFSTGPLGAEADYPCGKCDPDRILPVKAKTMTQISPWENMEGLMQLHLVIRTRESLWLLPRKCWRAWSRIQHLPGPRLAARVVRGSWVCMADTNISLPVSLYAFSRYTVLLTGINLINVGVVWRAASGI